MTDRKSQLIRTIVLAAGSSLALVLSGCGSFSSVATSAPAPVPSAGFSGQFMGGQQPVAGVSLQLYAAGTGGYGSAATPLLTPGAVKTTASGNFTLPSYTCPAANSLIYLVGTGGTPIGGSANANLALMVGLGPCGAINSSAFIDVNELTTVATVWSVSGFMKGISNIGAPASNLAGITNAFAAINKVVNTTNGQVSGPALPAGATLPIAEIDALGNILQNCVNSAGGAATDTTDGLTNGTPCGKLFYLSPNSGGTAPTDTITAAMNIAQHPSANTAKLNDDQSSSPAFSPALSVNSPPSDWTIAISYVGGGLNTPRSAATDSAGNVWVTNMGDNSVTELSSTGAAVSGAAGFTAGSFSAPWGIAIDQNAKVWVTNAGNNTLTRLDSGGTTASVFSSNGLSTPKGVAIDGAGNVWVANSGATTISGFTSAGAALTNSPFSSGGISNPGSIAVDPR